MKKILILTISFAGGALLLAGCSKSQKSGPAANNNNPATSVAGAGATANGPTELKIKWQTGNRYAMEMDLDQFTDITVRGQPIHTEVKMTQGLHYSPLKDLNDGGHQVEMEFDRQNLDVNQNGKDVLSYDSTSKAPIEPNSPAAPVAAVMSAMLGVPLDYSFAADGTVEKIDGIDALTNRINAAMPDQRQRASLEQLFDQETLKQYGSFSQSLPDHPVNIGDSWSSSHDINNPVGVMTVDTTYTFKGWEQHDGYNCVHLLMTGDIKTKSASAATVGAVVKIQKGTVNGDAWFDPDLGMYVDINSDQDMTMDITTRQMALNEHMKQNVELSLLDVTHM